MFRIKLELEKKNYVLESCHFSRYANVEQTNNTTSEQVSISFNIRFERVSQELIDWAMEGSRHRKDGRIVIIEQDFEQLVKSVTFQQGYCNSLSTGLYHTDDMKSYVMSFSIYAKSMQIKIEKDIK